MNKNSGMNLSEAEMLALLNQLEVQKIVLERQKEELSFQNIEKTKRADELHIANKELAFQNEEHEKRAA